MDAGLEVGKLSFRKQVDKGVLRCEFLKTDLHLFGIQRILKPQVDRGEDAPVHRQQVGSENHFA